tara:strand:- start:2119 stop:2277 length:159 start_codon:yes stop_codon:yes gene_type:complete
VASLDCLGTPLAPGLVWWRATVGGSAAVEQLVVVAAVILPSQLTDHEISLED